jgi:hypothetical protein
LTDITIAIVLITSSSSTIGNAGNITVSVVGVACISRVTITVSYSLTGDVIFTIELIGNLRTTSIGNGFKLIIAGVSILFG